MAHLLGEHKSNLSRPHIRTKKFLTVLIGALQVRPPVGWEALDGGEGARNRLRIEVKVMISRDSVIEKT